jgi:hypothetical protein
LTVIVELLLFVVFHCRPLKVIPAVPTFHVVLPEVKVKPVPLVRVPPLEPATGVTPKLLKVCRLPLLLVIPAVSVKLFPVIVYAGAPALKVMPAMLVPVEVSVFVSTSPAATPAAPSVPKTKALPLTGMVVNPLSAAQSVEELPTQVSEAAKAEWPAHKDARARKAILGRGNLMATDFIL